MRIQYRNCFFSEFLGTLVNNTSRSVQFHVAAAAERVLTRLTPQQTYRIQSVLQQILDAAPEAGSAASTASDATASGIDACHDLRQLIEDLTDAAAMPIDAAGEPVHTVENLSKLFDVSTKTISRWRRQGLIGRKFIIDGRKRVGFLKSSVDRFISGNRKQIERGSRFRQMTNQERKQIISEARRLSLTGCGMNEIAKQLAMELQRSPGTIRGTVKQYDQSHPESAIFPTNGAPLHEELRKKVFALYQQGRSIDQIAEQFERSSSTILRIVSMQRYEYIHNLPLDHVSHPSFSKIRNLVSVLGPMPDNATTAKKARVPSDLPSYLASLYEVPLLSREQEQHLFRKLNFAKYRANRLRSTLNAEQPQAKRMDEIEQLYDTAVATKNQIVRANLRLVVSIAKRHVGPQENFFELVSDGNISLIRAAEKFDYGRGFKFSTYASWAIMKNFARSIPNEMKQRDRFRTSNDELFAATQENRADRLSEELAHENRISVVRKILSRLDDREQKIIINRFGLDYTQEPCTLKQVGESMGVTKERVRQIESRALDKLRIAAEEDRVDPPGEG
ncbi:MAG: sigma-70 family RNA polymerase sigma factor [Pirellulales bacterium]|nr:sigma-70 family RNA polymerase sigma factor [Pirellulales bacterium]